MKERLTITQDFKKSPDFNEEKWIKDLIKRIIHSTDIEVLKERFNVKVIDPKDRASFAKIKSEADFERLRQLSHLANCNFLQYEAEF